MDALADFFNQVDAVLISSHAHISFLTGYSNFSKDEREAYLLITPAQKYILTDARYSEAVKSLDNFQLLEISGQTSMKDHLEKMIKKHQIKVIGVEGYSLTVEELHRFEKVVDQIKEINIGDIRSIKTDSEIQKITQACRLGDKVFKLLLKKIRPGLTEKKLAQMLELYVKKEEVDLSFETIVAFGAHSSVPHHQTGNTKLEREGEFILLDFGTRVENYCSDMTRTIFLGKASAKQRKIYQTVLAAQGKAAEFLNRQIKAGKKVLGKEVDQIARDYIIAEGYPSIPHSLGHGIGLQVHESPRLGPSSDDELVKGMVFSIEPGIYIPGFGGVRIEDLYVIEEKGLKQLTASSKELIELGTSSIDSS
jgi:Xaa-Pro aminopeptidase